MEMTMQASAADAGAARADAGVPGADAGAAPATVIGPSDGKLGFLGSIGARFMLDGSRTGENFALVEHPMSPRALAAPLHRHTREDEYSYVIEGRMGALLGEEVVEAGPGELVLKPRGQWHTFWNARDEPCRVLEIISPAGFERYFQELSALLAGSGEFDPAVLGELCERYALEMQPESIPSLLERFGLTLGQPLQ
jgi:mannose-6-phosphate isomerase-like protein (cupin superfamily)